MDTMYNPILTAQGMTWHIAARSQNPGNDIGPRHPKRHTTPGYGVQPQMAPEMTIQMTCHCGATPGSGEGSVWAHIPGTSTPMARGPYGPNPTNNLGSSVGVNNNMTNGNLDLQLPGAETVQASKTQVIQTPDSLGHFGGNTRWSVSCS